MKNVPGIVAKIAIMKDGSVKYDGDAILLPQLSARLAEIKARNGVVWYYREGSEGPAPTVSATIIKIIIDMKLPISLSTEADYSTVVLPDGTIKKRV